MAVVFRSILCSCVLLMTLGLGACGTLKVTLPEDVTNSNPPNMPVRTMTGFTEGLACMDRMLEARGVEPVFVTALNIPDMSEGHGAAGAGAREMIISSISAMGQQSGVLRYVAYDRATPDIIALQSVHPDKQRFKVPDFFIRGAITQVDKSGWSKQHGAGLTMGDLVKSFEGSGAHTSNSLSMSTVGLDLNMGMTSTFQILPGVFAANSMSVLQVGNSTEVTFSVEDVGAIFSINENRAKALSTALRSLVEVGVIELFGKLYNVPYWNCLAPLGVSDTEKNRAKAIYNSMTEAQRVKTVGEELQKQNMLDAGAAFTGADGSASDALRKAVAHYKAIHGLSGNSLINYNLFEKLYLQSLAPANNRTNGAEPVKPWLHKDAQKANPS